MGKSALNKHSKFKKKSCPRERGVQPPQHPPHPLWIRQCCEPHRAMSKNNLYMHVHVIEMHTHYIGNRTFLFCLRQRLQS